MCSRNLAAVAVLIAAALAAVVLPACREPAPQPHPRTLRISGTGVVGGTLSAAGHALADAYRAGAADLVVPEVLASGGAVRNLEMLEHGEVDVAFSFANAAYAASVGELGAGSGPFSRLRAMALLQRASLHLLAGPAAAVRAVEDLRGQEVTFGNPGSGLSLTVSLLLNEFGLDPDEIRAPSQLEKDVAELLAGRLAAVFVLGTPPVSAVRSALDGGARLLPLEGPPVDRMLRQHPFYSAIVIPADAYPGLPAPVVTIGVNAVLLCRADLDDDVVYRLTKAAYEAAAGSGNQILARWLDVSLGAATPVPLHPGAARYYREHELSP